MSAPTDRPGFKHELKYDETFESDFIGASGQDCQKWAVEQTAQNTRIEGGVLAIADTCSGRDDTIVMQFFNRQEPALEFGGLGCWRSEMRRGTRGLNRYLGVAYYALPFTKLAGRSMGEAVQIISVCLAKIS
jgi:hypothetical protein